MAEAESWQVVEVMGGALTSVVCAILPLGAQQRAQEESWQSACLWGQPHSDHLSCDCAFPSASWEFFDEMEP